MGPMCNPAQSARNIPAGFKPADGDRFVAMCNEVVYYENTFSIDGEIVTTGKRGNASAYLTSFLGNQTLDWLKRVAAGAAGGGAPFFAYLGPHAPHFPAEPAPWYADAPLPSLTAPRPPAYNSFREGKSWAITENAPFNDYTERGIDLHFRNRQRTLMSVDDYIVDIFAELEASGVLENTVRVRRRRPLPPLYSQPPRSSIPPHSHSSVTSRSPHPIPLDDSTSSLPPTTVTTWENLGSPLKSLPHTTLTCECPFTYAAPESPRAAMLKAWCH